VDGAACVVTDTWLSMADSEDEAAAREVAFAPYQVTAELMALAAEGAIFMHCLPAHRGEEVAGAVIDGACSVVFDEAENRLHAQKAILAWSLG
jgi:ornithine carbamoyltransferase